MNRSGFDPTLPTQIANANNLLQSIQTAQSVAGSGATPTDPPMFGFGAGVHQHLNQLLTLVYSKTTTLLAANMVLVSLLLSTRTSIKISLDAFYIGAVFCFSLSAVMSSTVLFPRLRRDRCGGLIFWRSILTEPDANAYYTRVQILDKAGIEKEYARDNYHLAQVIRLKDMLLRIAIALFTLGMICAVIGVISPMLYR